MECPGCHAANREGQRFCAQCGEALPGSCPACGAHNQPGDNFCGSCGRALKGGTPRATGRTPQPAPERRQLTAMFCDLVGSTSLSQQMDPEDLRPIILDFQDQARRTIARYDGFVARYMGDGVLAYFGFPQAHEDDTVRALHAALDIAAARAGTGPAVRVGIATGLAVVGDWIGEGGSEEAAAVGECVNLAARLQSLADPGGVVLSERTRQLAEGRFAFADLGAHTLRGFAHPVRAWQALRPTAAESRFDAVRPHGLTPFVGRAHEMERLLARWHQAVEGQGQVVTMVGEAGIGKSRIVETLAARLDGEAPVQLRCQCSPYHVNSALYPFIRQLEREAAFSAVDSTEQKLDKLDALLARSLPDPAAAPLLAALLSLPPGTRYRVAPLTPQQQKVRTIAALAGRVRALAAQRPLALVIEDAHWIDPTSMELLDLIVREAHDLRAAVFITSRTPLQATWSSLAHVMALPLERLSASESAAMVQSVAHAGALPTEVVAHIVAMTDGVPLFIEELTKALDAGPRGDAQQAGQRIRKSEIPLTLQDSLMARLDRLGAAKQVAQSAAVIGREFPRDLLALLSGLGDQELREALARLVSSAIVYARGPAAANAADAYVFKHALVQEAAHESLLRSRRQELHRHVSELLEGRFPERAAAEPEVLALHLEQAGQPLRAAGCLAAAAKRALDRYANAEALGHAAKGLALLAALPPDAVRDRTELALVVIRGTAYRAVEGFASAHVEQCFRRALALCEQLHDTAGMVEVRRGLFSFYYARGALDAASDQGHHVVELAQRSGERNSQMLGYWMLGCMAFWRGNFPDARARLEQAVALYRPEAQAAATLALQIDPGVNALAHLSWVLWILGEPDRAVETADRAVGIARGLAQPLALAMALFFDCATRACCGQSTAQGAPLDELVAVTTEHGLGYLRVCARVLRGQALIAADQCVQGIAEVEGALAEFEAQQAGLGWPWSLSILASGHLRRGHAAEGLAAVARAFAAIERNGERHWAAALWRLRGELLLLSPGADPDAAHTALHRALKLADSQGAHSLGLRAATRLALALLERGELAEARELLARARERVQGGLDTADVREAELLRARIDSAATGVPP